MHHPTPFPTLEPPAFDHAELELIAETLDGFLKIARGTVPPRDRLLIEELTRRVRALTRPPAVMGQDLAAAVDEVGDMLANKHGRSAVLWIDPGVVVVCGMRDDIELEWYTVRTFGQLVTTERADAAEIGRARNVLRRNQGAS